MSIRYLGLNSPLESYRVYTSFGNLSINKKMSFRTNGGTLSVGVRRNLIRPAFQTVNRDAGRIRFLFRAPLFPSQALSK